MKLRILKEDDVACDGGVGSSASMGISDNISVGSNAVNYGPSNPYFSNLKEYRAKEKRNKKRQYGSKNASHSKKRSIRSKSKMFDYNE